MADTDLLIEDQQKPPLGPISYEEFIEWCDDSTHAEWVDGQVILLDMTVWERHARIVSFLVTLFNVAAGLARSGRVYAEPFHLWFPDQRRARSPDVFYVLHEQLHQMRDHDFAGAPRIVVEVISPNSRRRDRIEKLAEYERAGVPEYWLLDSEQPGAEFRVLNPEGHYELAFSGANGLYQSTVLPQLRVRVEWFWQERYPSIDEMLRVLGPTSA